MPTVTMHPALRRSLATGAAAGIAFATVRALVRPLGRQDERTLVDWDRVRDVAAARCGERSRTISPSTRALEERYDGYAAELAPLMAAVCQSTPAGFPGFTVIDRRGFIDANVRLAQRLLQPAEELRAQLHESHATAIGRRAMSRYLGEMFGFVSKRVLGQYDPVVMLPESLAGERPSLYLVESNIAMFERTTGVSGESLRRYLILHELTHAWQFETHPWLRGRIAALLHEAVMAGLLQQIEPGERRGKGAGHAVLTVPEHVRMQLQAVSRIQALMSVLEGYSNFVMHRVGRNHLAGFDELEQAFRRRSTERPAIERLVLTVTGISMKLRQYDAGERFCEEVAEQGGPGLLNRVWEGPDFMPSMVELRHPDRWIARAG